MMPSLTFLQDFENALSVEVDDTNVSELPGYEAGFAEGARSERERQEVLKAEVVEKLCEMSFGYMEAKNGLMKSLGPLLKAICDQILPEIASDIHRSKIIGLLEDAARKDIGNPVELHVRSDQAAALQAAIPDPPPLPVVVLPKPTIAGEEIIFNFGGTETALNTSAAVQSIREVLELALLTNESRAVHG